jgi:hypothetical protein
VWMLKGQLGRRGEVGERRRAQRWIGGRGLLEFHVREEGIVKEGRGTELVPTA